MILLGLHTGGRDAAVFRADTGTKNIFALSVERATRVKHDGSSVAPALAHAPRGKPQIIAVPAGAEDDDTLRRRAGAPGAEVRRFDPALCHAASAYEASPYREETSLVLSLDSAGERGFVRRPGGYEEITSAVLRRPVPLGALYARATAAAGFTPFEAEGKLEAIAAFGQPVPDILETLKAARAADLPPAPGFLDDAARRHGRENLAASMQVFLEEEAVALVSALDPAGDASSLCLGGGVAANILMSLALWERTRFKKLHIAPWMGNEGMACGAAFLAAREEGADLSWIGENPLPYWGPSYGRADILKVLDAQKDDLVFEETGDETPVLAAREVAAGKVVALFQGGAEFGPRALGNRSILANPADPDIRRRLNEAVKHRPVWQPFCPSLLESAREKFFTDSFPHPHMAMAFRVRPEAALRLPCAVHANGTARPQIVRHEDHPAYALFLEELKKKTGFGVVINTSFNLHGLAIVLTPADACADFLACGMDSLFIGGFRARRKK